MPRLGVIELSQLPAFAVIETISTENIISARMAELVAEWLAADPPNAAQYDVGSLEFDPIRINQETASYFELLIRDRVNQAARAVTLAFATNGNLDAVASRYPGGVPRLTSEGAGGTPTISQDNAYRTRVWLSPNTLTQNGVYENYLFFSFTAATAAGTPLRDCEALATPGDPNIYITIMADGPPVIANLDSNGNWLGTFTAFPSAVPTTDQINTVFDYITAAGEARQGLTDVIHVSGPTLVNVNYDIGVYLYPGWDESLTMTQLAVALATLVENQRYLGYSHTRSAIDAALKVGGVYSIVVRAPKAPTNAANADILVPISPNQVVVVTSIAISYLGRGGFGPPSPTE